ncbi:MAG: hypothetical protein K6357_08355 [Elusimicrobiota bacterium]
MSKKNKFAFLLNLIISLILLIVWPLHINEKGHTHEDGECAVCISITSPQVNSDFGNKLINKPEGFILTIQLSFENILVENFFYKTLIRSPPILLKNPC